MVETGIITAGATSGACCVHQDQLIFWVGERWFCSHRKGSLGSDGRKILLAVLQLPSEARVSPSDESRIDILHPRPGSELDLLPDIG